MLKSLVPCLIIGVLLAVVAYFIGQNQNREKIEMLLAEKAKLETQKSTIEKKVAENDEIQKKLESKVSNYLSERDSLKSVIVDLEKERIANQISVRRLRNTDQIVSKFIDTYPQFNERNTLIFEHAINKSGTLKMDYVGVPSATLETFMIEHDRAQKYLSEKDACEKAMSIGDKVFVLQDSVLALEKEKFQVYKEAYEDAYNAYMNINKNYVDELQKPKFSLPHWGVIVGGAAAGYLIGKDK